MSNAQHVISFRLHPRHLELLTQRAPKGASPSAFARELVLRTLNEEVAVTELTAQIQEQQRLITELRKDLRITLQTLLITVAQVSHEKANELVNRNLR